MKKFGRDSLGNVEIYLAEPNEQVREGMRGIMRDYGMKRTRSFARLTDLVNAIKESPPDLLIAADDTDPKLFEMIRDIRHSRIGINPFMMISLMVRAEADGVAVKKAILAGADDVLVKPVAPAKMLDRVAHVTMNRQPFIVTNDYLGPERRTASPVRPSNIRQLDVVNTLKDTIEGRRMTTGELVRAVSANMAEVMAARLDSNGLKLAWVCGTIMKAYQEKRIDPSLHEQLLVLVSVLEDAGRTAHALKEPDLSAICIQMARQVEEMAEAYEDPTSLQLGTIAKLSKAFEMARAAKAAAG
ncbi:MAG: response regulator [Proteobacteria bacterium]|nr:response regulator [Pseudomonadota bacterium]